MMERKMEVYKVLQSKGLDVTRLEKELMTMLRKGASSIDLQEYLRKVIEGGEKA